MPVAAERERDLLNRYHLQSTDPTEWPHQDDEDDRDSESDVEDGQKTPTHQSKPSLSSTASVSKYRNIDRHASAQFGFNGAQKTARGEDSLVQKDERDPLGQHASVVNELRKRGLPIEENVKLRNRFMLSSTSFSPQMFLSNVHQDATTEDLLRGLDFLSRSIDEKSASLKVLVESNFEKFVRAKATIDNVYTEMRSQGAAPTVSEPVTKRTNARNTNSHFRNTSNSFVPNTKSVGVDKAKKTSLTKESEYGISGLKAPLIEITIKADEIWGPALGGREKETGLKAVVATLEQHRDICSLSTICDEAIRKDDYDTVVTSWNRARRAAQEARQIADSAHSSRLELEEQQVQQVIVTARMWHDLQTQVEAYKQDLWRRLKTSHGRRPSAVPEETMQELHMELIGVLLQLGVDENPIWQWLSSRVLYLRDRIARSFERSRIEIEIMRRKSSQIEDDPRRLASLHRQKFDSPEVLAFWERVLGAMNLLLIDILGEVIEFWHAANDFIDGKAQKKFPNAVFAAGLEHLSLEPDEVENIQSGAVELVNLIRDSIQAFFSDPPVADLSELYSPIPATPVTPASATKRTFTFDPSTVPALPAKKGDVWDKFAFWPPKGNSLAGAHYLSQLMAMVGTAATEMANLSIIKAQRSGPEAFKSLVGTVRERLVQATVAAWIPDAERSRHMETWAKSIDRKDLTTMPAAFISFQERVMAGMQKIAYVSDATGLATRGGEVVIVPPSAKLLQMIRGAFVTSLYKALSGMVENAEKIRPESSKDGDPDGVTAPLRGLSVENDTADSSNRNVRMLMTLSNLAFLRTETIPQLISQFESSFSVKLTEESKTIRDVLTQIDARLFQSYVKPTADHVQALITRGITDPGWPPADTRPDNARQYIYEVLLSLVYVHAEVSTTAAPLTSQILAYLLEQAGVALITAFRARPRYTLPSLMQATLDVEFLAQTLNNYTTDRASEVQSQIYLVLDERTEADARARLEGELPEMRGVLKRLREGTKGQFACFRRERRAKDGKGSGGGSAR